jgi:predicted Zn-dependent peptidase
MLDRKTPPQIHDAVEFDYKLPPINKHQLSNEIPLYWLNGGVQEVAEIDWVFPAGMWYEQKPAVSNAVAALLKNGTSKHSAQQINEALEFYGASLKVNTGNDNATVTLYTLTKHLPALLPMVYEILTDAIFPEEELAIFKQNSIQRLMVNLRQAEFVANQRIDALLFGEFHPYGRFTKKEKIEALLREDLLAFYNAAYNLSHVKIFMAGSVGEHEVELLEEIFGKQKLMKTVLHEELFSAPGPSEMKHRISNDPNGVQGAIRIGSLFPNRHHPDFAPMVVLNTLFGGYFGSRLMSNIREDKGYTYGIYSSIASFVNGGSLTIHTEVGRDVVEEAVKEIYHEMRLLCNEPADEEELLLVKNYLLGNLLGDLDGPFSIIQRWRTLILNGMDEQQFNRNIDIYKNITAKELQELAKKYYQLDNFYEVVVI